MVFPSIVLVPGAWSRPASYRKLITALESRDVSVTAVELPTCNGARPPNSSFEDDVKAVRDAVEPLVARGEDVLLVMHSYAGLVGCEAISGLSKASRKSQGRPGGVFHLAILCGYVLDKGQSVMSILEGAGKLEELQAVMESNPDGTVLPRDPNAGIYGALGPEDQEELNAALDWYNSAGFFGTAERCAWKEVLLTYFHTKEDYWCLTPIQKEMLERVKQCGVEAWILNYEGGHQPHVAFPAQVAQDILDILKGDN